jgi:hypothetical protein
MKGILPKRIAPSQLQCSKCKNFVDDDPDVYYCAADRPEFPRLCDFYELRTSDPVASKLLAECYKGRGGWEAA